MLPYLLNRDAGRPAFSDVLVIGAGTGNDVAAALAVRSRHVDAVEIEPVITEIGREDHPNDPYSPRRVSLHLTDGRSYIRNADKSYDLVAYGLVDSLVLHSGYSTLRLEELPVHQRGVSRRCVKAQPRRHLCLVQLLPPGLDRRPGSEDARRRSSAPSRW